MILHYFVGKWFLGTSTRQGDRSVAKILSLLSRFLLLKQNIGAELVTARSPYINSQTRTAWLELLNSSQQATSSVPCGEKKLESIPKTTIFLTYNKKLNIAVIALSYYLVWKLISFGGIQLSLLEHIANRRQKS